MAEAEFTFSDNPPREALEFFDRKNLRVGFDYRDIWKEEHQAAFTVAKAMQKDVLRDLHAATRAAIRDGLTLQQFRRQITPILQAAGWWGRAEMEDPETGQRREVQLGSPRRLKTIYRTNTRVARAAGQWERIQKTKNGLPYLLYRIGPSDQHRPEHVAWDGTILPVDDPWWNTHYPPNGWGCKCFVRAVTAREAERLGGASRRPRLQRRPWKNTRTGKTERIPRGIDPGWDYNPGKNRTRGLS